MLKQLCWRLPDPPEIQNFLGETERNKGVTVRLWNVADGRLIQSFAEHSNEVHSVAFSPDGKLFAGVGMDKRVIVWKTNH